MASYRNPVSGPCGVSGGYSSAAADTAHSSSYAPTYDQQDNIELLDQTTAIKQVEALQRSYETAGMTDEDVNAAMERGTLIHRKADDVADYDDFNDRVDEVWEKTDWTGSEPKSLSMFGGISTLTAGIIGCGCLGLPATMCFSGFTGFLLVILFVVYTSYLGGMYLGEAARLTGKSNLTEMAGASLGVFGKVGGYDAQAMVLFDTGFVLGEEDVHSMRGRSSSIVCGGPVGYMIYDKISPESSCQHCSPQFSSSRCCSEQD